MVMSLFALWYISMAPNNIREVFDMGVKGLEMSGKVRASCLVNVVWRFQKGFFWSGL